MQVDDRDIVVGDFQRVQHLLPALDAHRPVACLLQQALAAPCGWPNGRRRRAPGGCAPAHGGAGTGSKTRSRFPAFPPCAATVPSPHAPARRQGVRQCRSCASSGAIRSNGNSTQKRVPRCSALSKPMLPPIASVRPLAIVVPSPVPTVATGEACVGLLEGLEQALADRGGDADAGVGHGKPQPHAMGILGR